MEKWELIKHTVDSENYDVLENVSFGFFWSLLWKFLLDRFWRKLKCILRDLEAIFGSLDPHFSCTTSPSSEAKFLKLSHPLPKPTAVIP